MPRHVIIIIFVTLVSICTFIFFSRFSVTSSSSLSSIVPNHNSDVNKRVPEATLSSASPTMEDPQPTEDYFHHQQHRPSKILSPSSVNNDSPPRSFQEILSSIKRDESEKFQQVLSRIGGQSVLTSSNDKGKPQIFMIKDLPEKDAACSGAIYFPTLLTSNDHQQSDIFSIFGPADFDCVIQSTVMMGSLHQAKKPREVQLKSCDEPLFSSSLTSSSSSSSSSFYLIPFDVCNIAIADDEQQQQKQQLEVKIFLKKVLDNYDAVNESIETITKFTKRNIELPSFVVTKNMKTEKGASSSSTSSSYFWTSNSGPDLSAKFKPPRGIGYAPWQNMDLTLMINHHQQTTTSSSAAVVPPRTPKDKLDFWLNTFPDLASRFISTSSKSNKNSKLNIGWFGDSQPRTLFRHLQAVINKDHSVIQSKDFDIFAENSVAASRFLFDPYLARFGNRTQKELFKEKLYLITDSKRPKIMMSQLGRTSSTSSQNNNNNNNDREQQLVPDLIFLSMGPWPASFGQWSFEAYFNRTVEIRETVEELLMPKNSKNGIRKRKTRFINLGALSWPKPRSMPGFRISNARLRMFNKINRKVLVNNFEHVDLWHWTHCVGKKYHRGDHMHFSSAVLFEILRNLMLRFL